MQTRPAPALFWKCWKCTGLNTILWVKPFVRAGQEFTPGHAWVIPARQRQFGLAEAIMETRTRFEDETFYDVSAWTQPLAYNLPLCNAWQDAGHRSIQAIQQRPAT